MVVLQANVVICGLSDDDVYRRLGNIKGITVLRDWLPSTSQSVPSIVLSMYESCRVEHITPRMLLISRVVSNVIFVNLKWYTDVIQSNSLCPITTQHLNDEMTRIQIRQRNYLNIAPLQNYVYSWINDEEPMFRDFLYSLMLPMNSLDPIQWYSISTLDLTSHPLYGAIKSFNTTYVLSNTHGFIKCPKTNIRFNSFEDYIEVPLGKINRITRFDEICSEFISGFMFKPFEKILLQKQLINQYVPYIPLRKIPMRKGGLSSNESLHHHHHHQESLHYQKTFRENQYQHHYSQKKQKVERDLIDSDGKIRFEFKIDELFNFENQFDFEDTTDLLN